MQSVLHSSLQSSSRVLGPHVHIEYCLFFLFLGCHPAGAKPELVLISGPSANDG